MSTTLQGKVLEPRSEEEMNEAIGLAFDYRGDVTIHFKDDSKLTGYLYKYVPELDEVHIFVEIEPKSSVSKKCIVSLIQSIAFTGEDCAFGKSWEEYQAKKTS